MGRRFPSPSFNYVIRTRDSVLLHEAAAQEPFSADEYVRAYASRSILCLPLIKQAQFIGVLYLENSLASHVFTPARIVDVCDCSRPRPQPRWTTRAFTRSCRTRWPRSRNRRNACERRKRRSRTAGDRPRWASSRPLIVHEVTQPLAAIVTNADSCLLWLAKDEPNIEKARKVAERIVKNGHRAADLIRSIRTRARKAPVEAMPLDLNRLIEDTLELLQPELQRRAVSLETHLRATRAGSTRGDPTQLQQVVVNLVTNAIEALASRGRSTRTVRVQHRARSERHVCSRRWKTRAPASMAPCSSASSTRCSPPSRRAWAWGFRSVARSSRATAGACGSHPTPPAAASFASAFPRSP